MSQVTPRAHARVFCLTSVWMVVPMTTAVWHEKYVLALSLAFTMAASLQYWWHKWHDQQCELWHNLDRLGVVLILLQVDCMWWPVLAMLFGAGAAFERVRVQTRVWGGGVGKEAIEIWPLSAQRRHFQCHALCRYVAFWACCDASGHSVRLFSTTQAVPMVLYTILYLAHIVFCCKVHSFGHLVTSGTATEM